ncbi:MAG: hypothetical protein DI585_05810 [Pseudomonas fluorescens]|nr:MAG: hypothetical protein DI585_05810 [Pseudomonas fluorescens]
MGWKAWIQYVLLKIRRSASDPHHVAMGMAIGMWANFLPLPGLGGTLSVTFAWLLRANMMSAFVGQLLGNAWTMPFIWWICYKTGLIIFPIEEHGIGFRSLMANFNMEYFLENWRILARSVLLPVAVGGQIIGIPLAIISYWLTHWEVKRFWAYRRRVKEASLKRNAERKAARALKAEA